MTSTTLETLTVRCFAGVLDAVDHCQYFSIRYSRIQHSTDHYAITLARLPARAALLQKPLVELRARGAQFIPTNSRWHHVLITPYMQSDQGQKWKSLERFGAWARRRGV
jgi:hypothetical protein